MRWKIRNFEFDDLAGQLRQSEVVKLRGNELRVLTFLVKKFGQEYDNVDITASVWKGSHGVTPDPLYKAIQNLRDVFGGERDSYIASRPYRLIAKPEQMEDHEFVPAMLQKPTIVEPVEKAYTGEEITAAIDVMPRVPLCLFHRMSSTIRDKYYGGALSSGKHVFYLSIMSRGSFDLVKKYLADNTTLTVLTWNPKTRAEIVGFSKHLSEGDDKIEQTQSALGKWDVLLAERKNIAVYTYRSTPTMQGVLVEHQWALIELIPYATRTHTRPALLLRRDVPAEQVAFELFSDCFRRLRDSAAPRQPGMKSNWFHKGKSKRSNRKRKHGRPE